MAINRQIDDRELRVNAHTIVCGRSAITNRVRASVWAFTHALANVDLAVETLFSITPVPYLAQRRGGYGDRARVQCRQRRGALSGHDGAGLRKGARGLATGGSSLTHSLSLTRYSYWQSAQPA